MPLNIQPLKKLAYPSNTAEDKALTKRLNQALKDLNILIEQYNQRLSDEAVQAIDSFRYQILNGYPPSVFFKFPELHNYLTQLLDNIPRTFREVTTDLFPEHVHTLNSHEFAYLTQLLTSRAQEDVIQRSFVRRFGRNYSIQQLSERAFRVTARGQHQKYCITVENVDADLSVNDKRAYQTAAAEFMAVPIVTRRVIMENQLLRVEVSDFTNYKKLENQQLALFLPQAGDDQALINKKSQLNKVGVALIAFNKIIANLITQTQTRSDESYPVSEAVLAYQMGQHLQQFLGNVDDSEAFPLGEDWNAFIADLTNPNPHARLSLAEAKKRLERLEKVFLAHAQKSYMDQFRSIKHLFMELADLGELKVGLPEQPVKSEDIESLEGESQVIKALYDKYYSPVKEEVQLIQADHQPLELQSILTNSGETPLSLVQQTRKFYRDLIEDYLTDESLDRGLRESFREKLNESKTYPQLRNLYQAIKAEKVEVTFPPLRSKLQALAVLSADQASIEKEIEQAHSREQLEAIANRLEAQCKQLETEPLAKKIKAFSSNLLSLQREINTLNRQYENLTLEERLSLPQSIKEHIQFVEKKLKCMELLNKIKGCSIKDCSPTEDEELRTYLQLQEAKLLQANSQTLQAIYQELETTAANVARTTHAINSVITFLESKKRGIFGDSSAQDKAIKIKNAFRALPIAERKPENFNTTHFLQKKTGSPGHQVLSALNENRKIIRKKETDSFKLFKNELAEKTSTEGSPISPKR